MLGAVKDVCIPRKPGGGDGDTRDHEPSEHPGVGVQLQLAEGHWTGGSLLILWPQGQRSLNECSNIVEG